LEYRNEEACKEPGHVNPNESLKYPKPFGIMIWDKNMQELKANGQLREGDNDRVHDFGYIAPLI